MKKLRHILCFLLIYLYKFCIAQNDITNNENCAELCAKNLFILPAVYGANNICERGCRFFELIDAKGELNYNKTNNECHISCNQAYTSENIDACSIGCTEMHKKREQEISKNFVVILDDGQNNLMILQPDLQEVDLDILADPGLRQFDFGYSVEYKIPETRIRTMPIEDANLQFPSDLSLKTYQPSGDWLDCASRNSGIPRWMLITAILLAVLLGIWLIFASEKRETIPKEEISDQESLLNDLPPKYSLESEKV